MLVSSSITRKFSISPASEGSFDVQLWLLPSLCDKSRSGNVNLAKLCFPALVWNIWSERNNRIFKGEMKSPDCPLHEIVHEVSSRASFLCIHVSDDLGTAWGLSTGHQQIRLPLDSCTMDPFDHSSKWVLCWCI